MLRSRTSRRATGDRRARVLVIAGLVAFVVGVYVVVVLGGGALVGRTDRPDVVLSVLATAVVALAFEPVERRLADAAGRWVRGENGSPYDVLSRFRETVTGGWSTEEVPGRTAEVLGRGTGAAWAQVWLAVSGRLVLAATWPAASDVPLEPPETGPSAVDATGAGRRALPVRHGGEVLGVLRLQEQPDSALTSVEERLFAGLAAQAGLVLRLVGLQTELAARHADLQVRAAELQASRERLIATQDAERRRLERDIHDGAQQHLVALAVNLRLVETIAGRSPERAAAVLRDQAAAAGEAVSTLQELSRGIYPRRLADDGLVPALRAAMTTSAVPVAVEADALDRLPGPIEAALYFVVMEAVQNAAKHAAAQSVAVAVRRHGGAVRATVTDDGVGFAPEADTSGTGLTGMRDRLDAVGGVVTVTSRSASGTTVVAEVPLPERAGAEPLPTATAAG